MNGSTQESSNENEVSPQTGVAATNDNQQKPRKYWKLWFFGSILVVDGIFSFLLLRPTIPAWNQARNETSGHYTTYGSLLDLAILAALRLLMAILGIWGALIYAQERPEFPFALHHPNGDKKSREELEQEALEEAWGPWLWRSLTRPAFGAEFVALLTEIWAVVKCMVRMNEEIGTHASQDHMHPVFWVAILVTTLFALLEANWMDSACKLAGQYGKEFFLSDNQENNNTTSLLRTISSSLNIPLLSAEGDANGEAAASADGEEVAEDRGVSDIGADAKSRATWSDLLQMCYPDLYMIILAFVFLLLAAVAQVYIPRSLGNILDALGEAFDTQNQDDDASRHESMFEVPGFMKNVKLLVLASLSAGVFSGLRGSIFTVVGGRVNVRLRVQLMDALLSQDIGFFDVTKTGDITSRLSSDTTLVGDQVMLNVNVFLRSLVQAVGVLLFMFLVSWQLSILAFISVPLITILSKWYGNYVRALTKLMQKKLADGNSVSEAALGSMSTVRAFDAAEAELHEFEQHMEKYLKLNVRSAFAYFGYATFTTAVPQLVFAVVVFYGGFMVRNGEMTSGKLVSFLLYLQSLSDAFASLGWVFSALTQAVGAADKVFELMKREPQYKRPTTQQSQVDSAARAGILGIEAKKTREQRLSGVHPEQPKGEIKLDNVELCYPARPLRRVLNGLSLNIEPGQIVALVGRSGGGKSSLMSLIQHLYEPSNGKVMLDGHEVHEIAPQWLSRNISIVSQEPTLFARSIKRNIMYGLEGTEMEPSDEEIEHAARLANAGFIYDFPQRFDTEVGERGVQLSGGQKQRIAIARALVRKPKVLLLDEATSALDAESEHLVQSAIDDMLARGKSGDSSSAMTVVLAAHRLSTVRSADKIFVIQDGHVVEEGSHVQLLEEKPNGAYAALIRRQLEAQEKLDSGSPKSSNTSIAKTFQPKIPI